MFAPFASLSIALATWACLAQQAPKAGIDKLDGATRAKVLAALAALVILGFGLVALAWMGARFTRRYMATGPRGSSGVRKDEWVRRSPQDEPDSTSLLPPPD